MELQPIILPDFVWVEHSIAVDDVTLRTSDLVSVTELERHVGRDARESKTPCFVRLLRRHGLVARCLHIHLQSTARHGLSVIVHQCPAVRCRWLHGHVDNGVAMNAFSVAIPFLIAIDEE